LLNDEPFPTGTATRWFFVAHRASKKKVPLPPQTNIVRLSFFVSLSGEDLLS
jgi:hypothetical protein